MTKRSPVTPAPGPLEGYAARFDELFGARAQRQGFRRYLEGLLLPAERNKTLTALANTEPLVAAQHARAQSLQWFLSESGWDPRSVNARRIELLRADPKSAPNGEGVLVIDEHGDRKWGKKTAHVGRQWLANMGKVDNGVVSVSSVWADEGVYYPLEVEPYTPEHHFEKGKASPAFRTKLKIALELVKRSVVEMGIPFRAVVADSFYGEDEGFREGLREVGVGYVLALKPSHSWWHKEGTIGALWEVAEGGAGWKDESEPGEWVEVVRAFRDGHEESWWALEVKAGPYAPERGQRAFVVSTDPEGLPDLGTWYLVTNLPAPDSERARREEGALLPAADLAEVVRLYGLRMWVEQSYKQVKHALGWSQYQVRSDPAIRRHWQLVCCAFSFCWWASSSAFLEVGASPQGVATKKDEADTTTTTTTTTEAVERGGKGGRGEEATIVMAESIEEGKGMAGAVRNGVALLEGVLLGSAPAKGVRRAA
jgi:hypothetical protein